MIGALVVQHLFSTSGRAFEQRDTEALLSSWADDVPPRELTGGWPAIRLDEPRETQQFEEVRVDRTVSRPPVPGVEREEIEAIVGYIRLLQRTAGIG